jgi:hypothetical protein
MLTSPSTGTSRAVPGDPDIKSGSVCSVVPAFSPPYGARHNLGIGTERGVADNGSSADHLGLR